MGFEDIQHIRELLEKNMGSVEQTVVDLLNFHNPEHPPPSPNI